MLRLCMGFSLLRPGGQPYVQSGRASGARPGRAPGLQLSRAALHRCLCSVCIAARRRAAFLLPAPPARPSGLSAPPASPAPEGGSFLLSAARPRAAVSGHAHIKQGPPQRGGPCFICALSPAPLQSAHRCTGGCRRLLHAYSAQPSAVHAASAAGTASHTPVMPHTAAMANASGTSRIKPRRSESTCAGSACSTAGK